MLRAVFFGICTLSLAACVTNNLTTQNAQVVPAGGAAVAVARPTVMPVIPASARLAAAKLITIHKTTMAGAKLMIGTMQSLAADCTPLGAVDAKVITPPEHGKILIEKGMAFSGFSPGDIHVICNTKKSPATLISYRSEPDFSGQDTAVVQIFFPNGNAPTILVHIAVK